MSAMVLCLPLLIYFPVSSFFCFRTADGYGRQQRRLVALFTLLLTMKSALAFNGMALPGVGVAQVAMAGAGTALLADSVAVLRNPAAGSYLESGRSVDLALGIPKAGYSATATGSGSRISIFEYHEGQYRSVYKFGAAPSFAQNWRLNERWSVGWGLYGAGIGSTLTDGAANIARGIPLLTSACQGDFGGGVALQGGNPSQLCGNGNDNAGIQLVQITVSAPISYKFGETLSLGLSPLLGLQQLSLKGLAAFAPFSVDSANTTDQDADYSWGFGYRVGLHHRPLRSFEWGVSYQPRMHQTRFDQYAGALVSDRLDIPANLNVGLHLKLHPKHSLAIDWDRVFYDGVPPLAASPDMHNFVNQCVLPRLVGLESVRAEGTDYCLGGSKGPGFGWGRMTVVKIGYQLQTPNWAWRIGYSYGGSPIKTKHALMTALAPAVGSEHLATGLAWRQSSRLQIGLALSYALRHRTSSRNGLSNATLQAGTDSTLESLLGGNPSLVALDVSDDTQDQWVHVHMDTWQIQLGLNWRLQAFH